MLVYLPVASRDTVLDLPAFGLHTGGSVRQPASLVNTRFTSVLVLLYNVHAGLYNVNTCCLSTQPCIHTHESVEEERANADRLLNIFGRGELFRVVGYFFTSLLRDNSWRAWFDHIFPLPFRPGSLEWKMIGNQVEWHDDGESSVRMKSGSALVFFKGDV